MRPDAHWSSHDSPRVLLVAYGGGHMRMLVPVARTIAEQGGTPLLFPLTVAIQDARQSGLPHLTLSTFFEDDEDRERLISLGKSIAGSSAHPAISDAETWLYHGVGLSDLIDECGSEAAAHAQFADAGRRAFHPKATWRTIIDRLAPDVVVTTNSPRSESAALHASEALDIPSLCVTDHFLAYEMDYISRPGHGRRITVLSGRIGERLIANGRPAGEVLVTGNPAFDLLSDPVWFAERDRLRKAWGWTDRQVILWPRQAASVQVGGKQLLDPRDVLKGLVQALDADSDRALIVRPHPKQTTAALDLDGTSIRVEPDLPIEALLHACDVVVQESTTVGIQAALLGKPVLTIANKGMPPFAEYGLARDLEDPSEISDALNSVVAPDLAGLDMPEPGKAAQDIAKEILRLAGSGKGKRS